MARRRTPNHPATPPILPPHRAMELLRRQLSRVEEVRGQRHDDPEIRTWEATTVGVFHQAFGRPGGEPHELTSGFEHAIGGPLHVNMRDEELQRNHVGRTNEREAILRSAIEQLELLAPPAAGGAGDAYRFHPEIERVSGDLYRNRHYREAALNAYIRVIEEVKRRSRLETDGDDLVNRAFSCSNRNEPVVRFNDLATEADRDEQMGFFYLFKGVVGLRNSKAHSTRLFDDPSRAHEYLALASLLLRLLETARVNSPN